MRSKTALLLACILSVGCGRRSALPAGEAPAGEIREVVTVKESDYFGAFRRDPAAAAVQYPGPVRLRMAVDDVERLPGGKFLVTRDQPGHGHIYVTFPASAAASLAGKNGTWIEFTARLVDVAGGEMRLVGEF